MLLDKPVRNHAMSGRGICRRFRRVERGADRIDHAGSSTAAGAETDDDRPRHRACAGRRRARRHRRGRRSGSLPAAAHSATSRSAIGCSARSGQPAVRAGAEQWATVRIDCTDGIVLPQVSASAPAASAARATAPGAPQAGESLAKRQAGRARTARPTRPGRGGSPATIPPSTFGHDRLSSIADAQPAALQPDGRARAASSTVPADADDDRDAETSRKRRPVPHRGRRSRDWRGPLR